MAASQQLQDGRREGEETYGWTRQKMLDLVEAYRSHPCLYDSTGPGYHNREERARAWIAIADTLGREEDEVRAKMKSIRTQYARIIQKGQHPKSKTGNPVSSWWLLETLNFLDEFISPRKLDSESIKENEFDASQVSQIGRMYPDETSNSIGNGDHVTEMIYDDGHAELDMSQVPGNSVNNMNNQPTEDVTVIHDTSPYQSPYTQRISPIHVPVSRPTMSTYRANRLKVRKSSRPLKKLKRDHMGASISPAVKSNAKPDSALCTDKRTASESEENLNGNLLLKTVLAFAERSTRDEDEDAVFGRYVGNEMRGVTDLQAKRIAKMRIQKVLFEAQTGWTETSNEGVYQAPRDGSQTQENLPAGVVCGSNNTRIL